EWAGSRLVFRPLSPLEANRDYTVAVAAGASDSKGLSLDNKFTGSFTTRPSSSAPRVVSIEPGSFGILEDEWGKIKIIFSEPVPPASLLNYVSFNPSAGGVWDTEGNAAVFTPAAKWITGQRYEIRISSSFAGMTGLSLGKDITSVFISGTDTKKPFLAAARALEKDGSQRELAEEIPGTFVENPLWEKDDKLVLVFQEEVDAASVRSALSVEGAAPPVLETMPGTAAEIVFSLSETPKWEGRFLFRLGPGVRDAAGNESEDTRLFRVYADGPRSKPPSLAGIRLPMAPGKDPGEREPAVYSVEDLFEDLPIGNGEGRFPYSVETPEWIELYFDTAEDASVDLLSLMGLFRVDATNNALSFSPRTVRNSGFSEAAPEPIWKNLERIEIRGMIVNRINSGIVSFIIGAGLRDSLGNTNENDFRIPLLK
ncbi:MAG: Ig-like domain-containing protein, partial [Treponema sp.]|nr:Ig-like domain-containing protein [Treponema sp.]